MTEQLQDKLATADEAKRRIEARKAAEEIVEVIEDISKDFDSRFWDVLMDRLNRVTKGTPAKVEAPDNVPMTDEESKKFGNQIIPFGEFQGTRVDEVPLYRLQWYADQRFVDELRRYLHSQRIKREYVE